MTLENKNMIFDRLKFRFTDFSRELFDNQLIENKAERTRKEGLIIIKEFRDKCNVFYTWNIIAKIAIVITLFLAFVLTFNGVSIASYVLFGVSIILVIVIKKTKLKLYEYYINHNFLVKYVNGELF